MISWHAIGAYAQFPGARNASIHRVCLIQGHHACLLVAHCCDLVVQCNCNILPSLDDDALNKLDLVNISLNDVTPFITKLLFTLCDSCNDKQNSVCGVLSIMNSTLPCFHWHRKNVTYRLSISCMSYKFIFLVPIRPKLWKGRGMLESQIHTSASQIK